MPTDFVQERIGRLLADRYELLDFLGSGGFAAVYRARNRRLGRVEALKILTRGAQDDPDFARRFEQEAQVCAALDHPGIVKIFDYGRIEEVFYFSMQFIDGPTVSARQRESGNYAEEEAARIALSVLDALDYSHRRGVIHRDVKPDNIILDNAGRPYLMDFGVAKAEASKIQTQIGTVLGSPAYLSPEQVQGARLDGRSDLYSLGAALYKMLSGSVPFLDPDPMKMVVARLREDAPPLSASCPGVSPEFEAIVRRALERDPEKRYPTAAAMRESVEDYLFARKLKEAQREREALDQENRPTSVLRPGLTPELAAPRPPAAAAAPERSVRWKWAVAILAAAAAVSAIVVWRFRTVLPGRPEPSIPPAARAAQMPGLPVPATAAAPGPGPTSVRTPTLSPPTVSSNSVSASPPTGEGRRGTEPPAPKAGAGSPPPGKPAVTPPEIAEQVAPQFPESARRAGVSGTVGVGVLVDAEGNVKSATIISPFRPDCDFAVLEAVKRWRFKPARAADGTAVAARIALPIEISFKDDP